MYFFLILLDTDLESYHLRDGLMENEDFVLIPAEAWHKLLSWYGRAADQPPLERKVGSSCCHSFLSDLT